jgi:polar amino acid transport system permease protein
MELAQTSLPALLSGTAVALELTFICILSGFLIGVLVALGRVYGQKPIYLLSSAYVEFIRGTPLLVQLFIIYYGLPDIGIVLRPVLAAGLAFGINTAAYQAEYFRGAIQSIGAGQMQAARSLGMGKWQAILHVILPQALRIAIPAWSNELIYMLKYTSLAFVVGVPEIVARANMIASRNFRYFELYILAAVIYLVLVSLITWALGRLERRVAIPGLERRR